MGNLEVVAECSQNPKRRVRNVCTVGRRSIKDEECPFVHNQFMLTARVQAQPPAQPQPTGTGVLGAAAAFSGQHLDDRGGGGGGGDDDDLV